MSDMAEIAKIMARLTILTNTLSSISVDLMFLLRTVLPRCSVPGCANPCTVKHRIMNHMEVCDRHCAELITLAKHGVDFDPEKVKEAGLTRENIKDMHVFVSAEELWEDVPGAEMIRRIDDHVKRLVKQDIAVIH